MPVSPDPVSLTDLPDPDNLIEVGAYATERQAFEHSLVILAMGLPCWLLPSEGGRRLMVESGPTDLILRQLRAYDRESVGWPPQPIVPAPSRPLELATPLLWSLVTLAAFWAEALHPGWVGVAALDRAGIFQRHEWWRPVTALFVHADTGHLVSNALSGIFVFAAVLSQLGRWRGWLAILLAAVLGNVAAVLLQTDLAYRSVGASTAVFAGVGLLTGRALRQMSTMPMPHRWRAMAPPLMAGATVVALYGAGGAHIDVGAHVTGFLAGLFIGVLLRAAHRDQGS